MKRTIYTISRIFLGLVFTLSGFVKAVDPMGTAIKFSDYFKYAFNLPQLDLLSLPLSLLLCATEFSIGILLLFNILPKLFSKIALILMIIFTPLTLYLAVFNPVRDCGCFGDAIKLTNWQTFAKNIIIDFFLIFVLLWNKNYLPKMQLKLQKIIALSVILFVFGFELFNYSFLPIIDFRPYKIGANLKELMTIPPNAPKDEFQTILLYKNKKTGKIKEFTEDNYPWQDTITWEWVDTRTKLIKKGYTPPIHDFEPTDLNGNSLTDSIVNDTGIVVWVVTYMFEDAQMKNLFKVKNFLNKLTQQKPAKIYCFTSSNDDVINSVIDTLKANNWHYCKIDEVTSKTIIRSNPGVVILKNGTIIAKLHYHSLTDKVLKKILKKL